MRTRARDEKMEREGKKERQTSNRMRKNACCVGGAEGSGRKKSYGGDQGNGSAKT